MPILLGISEILFIISQTLAIILERKKRKKIYIGIYVKITNPIG